MNRFENSPRFQAARDAYNEAYRNYIRVRNRYGVHHIDLEWARNTYTEARDKYNSEFEREQERLLGVGDNL